MKLWLAIESYVDGSSVLGVFSSREKAEAHLAPLKAECAPDAMYPLRADDIYSVMEYELDVPK